MPYHSTYVRLDPPPGAAHLAAFPPSSQSKLYLFFLGGHFVSGSTQRRAAVVIQAGLALIFSISKGAWGRGKFAG